MPDTPSTNPVPEALRATEAQQFRQAIEEFTPAQLMEAYRAQSAQLEQRQQVIQEILEDFNSAGNNIEQSLKNSMIEELSRGILEENSRLLESHDQRMSLASHINTSENPVLWGVKLQLMEGTLSRTAETFKETSGSFLNKLKAVGKYLIAILTVLRGGRYAASIAPSSSAETTSETSVQDPDQAPETARALSNVEVIDHQGNADAGYITVRATVDGNQVTRLIKNDGSEIKAERGGETLQETHPMLAYLQEKRQTFSSIRGMVDIGSNNNRQKVALAKSIWHHQQQENSTANPLDIATVINDNWRWIENSHDTYKERNDSQRLTALLETPANAQNDMIQALKRRYEQVRTNERPLHIAKRRVQTKCEETERFILSKIDRQNSSSQQEINHVRNAFRTVLARSRSLQSAHDVYMTALSLTNAELLHFNEFTMPFANHSYGSSEDLRTVVEKVEDTSLYFSTQVTAASQSTS